MSKDRRGPASPHLSRKNWQRKPRERSPLQAHMSRAAQTMLCDTAVRAWHAAPGNPWRVPFQLGRRMFWAEGSKFALLVNDEQMRAVVKRYW